MDFRTQAHSFLYRRQILHQEYPLVRGFLEGHGVLQDLCIFHLGARSLSLSCPPPGRIEAIALQELEGIIPRASRFELEAVKVFFIVISSATH